MISSYFEDLSLIYNVFFFKHVIFKTIPLVVLVQLGNLKLNFETLNKVGRKSGEILLHALSFSPPPVQNIVTTQRRGIGRHLKDQNCQKMPTEPKDFK